jgi:hypothetical protein
MPSKFSQYAVADFEYETSRDGILFPVQKPLWLVVYILDTNLRHVRTIRLWREQLLAPKTVPFNISSDTLFIAYSAWAELTCFLALGWPFPHHIFDLHTAYLYVSNILQPHDYDEDDRHKKPGKGLADACRAYGIAGWENIEKKQVAQDIGESRWQKYGQTYIFNYCEEDVARTTDLLRFMVRGTNTFKPIPIEQIIWWSEYSAKAVAKIQSRGIPWDVELWYLVQEHRPAILRELRRQFDPSFDDEKTGEDDGPIYNDDNEWSDKRFENWLRRNRIPFWPRLPSGRLSLDSDAFKLMYFVPGVEDLHALRDVIGFISKARIPIGSDGRNHPSLFPFGTATGRNAHAKSPFNVHAGMRSFIRFPTDKIGAYLDWRTQEVGIWAGLSGCSQS